MRERGIAAADDAAADANAAPTPAPIHLTASLFVLHPHYRPPLNLVQWLLRATRFSSEETDAKPRKENALKRQTHGLRSKKE